MLFCVNVIFNYEILRRYFYDFAHEKITQTCRLYKRGHITATDSECL